MLHAAVNQFLMLTSAYPTLLYPSRFFSPSPFTSTRDATHDHSIITFCTSGKRQTTATEASKLREEEKREFWLNFAHDSLLVAIRDLGHSKRFQLVVC